MRSLENWRLAVIQNRTVVHDVIQNLHPDVAEVTAYHRIQ